MDDRPNELPIPPIADNDSKAKELLRVWAAAGKQHVSIATEVWEDPASWGIMLVDLAWHIAKAYERADGRNHRETLLRLKQGFDAEWDNQTDAPTGDLLDH